MKKLLFILAILLISTTWSKGQIFNTGQTIPTGATPLQSPDNVSFYLNKPDTTLHGKLGRFGGYELWSAKKIRYILDSLANAKQDTITLTTIGVGAATFDGQNLNIPIYSGVVSDATTTTKGIIQLAGDLSGTSASPTVVGLADKAPASGSANYIQASPSNPQNANILINGNITSRPLDNNYSVFSIQTHSNTQWHTAYFESDRFRGTMLSPLPVSNGDLLFSLYSSGYDGSALRETSKINFEVDGNVSSGVVPSNISFYTTNLLGLSQVRAKINQSGDFIINNLASTNPELLSHSPDGTIIPIANGTNGQVLKIVSGVPTFADNYSQQSLSGTNVTWNLANGKDATITLTGNTVITLTNATQGLSGTLWVTNPSTVYTITFAGYVNSIDPYIRLESNMVITSGGSKFDDYTFKYNGSKMNWNGTLDRH